MAAALVLVNGLPGSGKTTLARALAAELSCHLLSKDTLKEAIAHAVGGAALGSLGAIAMETAWSRARDMPGLVVIDSFWWKQRDLAHAGQGIARSGASTAIEVWCEVLPSVARERYAARRRDDIHDDERRLADDWETWARDAGPLAITPVIRVNTTQQVIVADVAAHVHRTLNMRGDCRPGEDNGAS